MNVELLRKDFPILSREIYGKPLVYLDNAATTQKPLEVLDAMREEYLNVNANVHRGIHRLSLQATELHEQARETVARFLHAGSASEIVFTRGTTEGINLVASSFCEAFMRPGDEVVVSTTEHHSNIVPWQLQAQRRGIVLRVIPMTDDGLPDMDAYAALLNERTKIVSLTHVSNVLGTVNPVAEMIRMAHDHSVPVLIDGAQSAPHFSVDVQALDCDFFVFSGHKVYGPTGIGVLYGKEAWLDKLPPYQGGGEMIANVSFEHTTFERPPLKFEAGTPDYVAAHGLARALDYVLRVGLHNIARHEHALTGYALERLREIDGITIYGHSASAPDAYPGEGVISFNVGSIHHMDIGTLLDRLGIAVRTGHHCAQPLMQRLGVTGTVRASFALYNTMQEVDTFVAGLRRVVSMF